MRERWTGPRATQAHGQLVIRYALAIVVAWVLAAVVGLVVGFTSVGSGDDVEAGYIAFGLAAICTFVAWFAARPAIVADHTGLGLQPLFASRVVFAWHEVQTIGVRDVRAARGSGPALLVEASDEREAKIDGLWVGATRGSLVRMQADLEAFVATLDIVRPRFTAEEAGDLDDLDLPEN